MPDIDTTADRSDERSPRFTRAIFGRILAVLAFVCLGTFAVVQSVVGDRNKAAQLESEETAQVEPLQKTDAANNGIDKPTFQPKIEALQVSFGDNKPSTQRQFTPPAPKTFGDNSFGKKPSTPPPASTVKPKSNSFASTFKPQTLPPATTKPALPKTAPIVVAKQAATPPPIRPTSSGGFQSGVTTSPVTRPPATRVAQLGDTSFGGRPAPPTGSTLQSTSQSLGNTLGNSINQATKKTSEFASDLRDSASRTTGNALQGVRDGFNSATKTANDTVNGVSQSLRSGTDLRPTTRRPSSQINSGMSNSGMSSRQAPPTQRSPVTFDTTRDLKPFGQTPQPKTASTTRSTTLGQSQPFTRSGSGSPPPRQPAQRGAPPTRFASSSSPVAAAKTKRVPGDRNLEGVRTPSLTVEKVAPREVQLDQPADFVVVVRNAGRVAATDVKVFDRVPEGTEFLSAVPQTSQSSSGELQWDLGEMRPGQEKRIKYQLRPVRPGEIGSVAHVTFATQASMRTLVTKPVLNLYHSAKPKVLIGDNVVLDITVENKGDGPAKNVILQEDVPDQFECSVGQEIEFPIGTLAPGQSKKLKLGLKAVDIGRLRNILFAKADGNLKTQHAIDMEVIAPRLVTTANGPSRKFLRREASHTFSVANQGTANATNVELIAKLPGGLKFIGANNRGKYDTNSHAVYWSLAELTPGVTADVELQTTPIESGEQKINFEAVADLNQKSDTSTSLLVEHLIDVFFDIDDAVDPIEIGAPTRYLIRVVNQGTKTATNVQLQVVFPNGLQPVSVDGNLTNEINGQNVNFSRITSMNPGDELKLIVNAKGTGPGDHRVVVHMRTDGREANVSKEETTRVYDDR